MILPQRRRHLFIWIAIAALLPLGLLAAILSRPVVPPSPVERAAGADRNDRGSP